MSTDTETTPSATDQQKDVIAFLSSPDSYPGRPDSVEIRKTHGALVFLAGEEVFKIKRAVRYSYMDFSTLEKRARVCRREIEINRVNAPDYYLGTVPITRKAGGGLEFAGPGEVAEWAVHMRRFDEDRLFERLAAAGGLTPEILKQTAREIAALHARAKKAKLVDGTDRLARIAEGVVHNLAKAGDTLPAHARGRFARSIEDTLEANRSLLDRRATSGFIRRCHGDLHLGNIVLGPQGPVLFDAIEFSETIATVDVLYDLAFLLMDLWRMELRNEANLVLNRYLYETGNDADLTGLAALPLFLALRAGIRAMVLAQKLALGAGDAAAPHGYLDLANKLLALVKPRLVGIGGFSGTGKSTLAAGLASEIGAAPGAVHLRSDLLRKQLAGVAETERLPAGHYTKAASDRVYGRLFDKAKRTLKAGRAVIVDAVFARQQERDRLAGLADAVGVGFTGLWLEAGEAQLKDRVAARRDDASDADQAVIARQIARGAGKIDWIAIDASGTPPETLDKVRRLL
jgi:aminoglycoside phosphotransferase family enzyme